MIESRPSALVGDGLPVPCVDGVERPYANLDTAASTGALPGVFERVVEFVPWYPSVHWPLKETKSEAMPRPPQAIPGGAR